jgi:hypothetical protein
MSSSHGGEHEDDSLLEYHASSARWVALMMETVRSTETSVYFYETIRCHILEGCSLHTHRRENLKSHSLWSGWVRAGRLTFYSRKTKKPSTYPSSPGRFCNRSCLLCSGYRELRRERGWGELQSESEHMPRNSEDILPLPLYTCTPLKFQRIMVLVKNVRNRYTSLTLTLINNCSWWLNDLAARHNINNFRLCDNLLWQSVDYFLSVYRTHQSPPFAKLT